MRFGARGAAVIAGVVLSGACAREAAPPPPPPAAPDVVLFVGEGLGVGAWSVGREYARSRGKSLVLDEAPSAGFLETGCADALVTDAAAAATAWSTGELGARFTIGSRDDPPRPSLFERLRAADRAYGVVTTGRLTDASAAPFWARLPGPRGDGAEMDAARELLDAPPTVAIGGGRRQFRPADDGGARADGRDLLVEARDRGIAVLDSLVTPLPADRPVLALLAEWGLPHETDRRGGPELKDLVLAAIDRLQADGRPYFLLVEDGGIESACHDHDAATLARDVLRLDRAVRAVLERVDPESTLVVVAADHATDNPALHETAHPESLDVVSMSAERMERRIFAGSPWHGTPRSLEARALPILDAGARHTGLAPDDLDRLLLARDRSERTTALGHLISRRFGISFLSYRDHVASARLHGSTGEPVPVRAWGVRSAEVAGTRDHARFGRWLADVLRLPATPATGPPAPADSSGASGSASRAARD
jgi:alkaline phosphatase